MGAVENYVDGLILAMRDNSNQNPFINQLRAAVDLALNRINEDNLEQVGVIANGLLSQIQGLDKAVTFTLLMSRMAKVDALPPDMMALTTKLANSTLQPMYTQWQAAALGLGTPQGFTPSPGNTLYHPGVDFKRAMCLIDETITAAREESTRLLNLSNHQPGQLRDHLRKLRNREGPNSITDMRLASLHIFELLENGHDGWKLYKLPNEFFEKILPAAWDWMHAVKALSLQPHCGIFKDIAHYAWMIRQALSWLQGVRDDIGKLQYEARMKQSQIDEFENMRLMLEGASLEPGFDEQLEALALEAPAECEKDKQA